MAYIPRDISPKILEAIKYYPVIILTGPRQSGKTTLARHLFKDYSFVNLEDMSTRNRATNDVNEFLDSLGAAAIIDEVQNYPELLSTIQARVDMNKGLRYILTGSNNFALLQHSFQSLVGRAAHFTVLPFSFKEQTKATLDVKTSELMFRGQYPGVLADGIPPQIFYRNYYSTYIERDIRQLSNLQHLDEFQKFMRLCAARAGSELKLTGLAIETGMSVPTISSWLSLLGASYITFTLRPYYANLKKRLTKSPKLYFYDTGLLAYLLGIEDAQQLDTHPLRGAVFENLAVLELLKERNNEAKDPNLFFYRENSGREVDVLQTLPDGIRLYEVKSGKTFQKDFTRNLDYLKNLLPDVVRTTVVYDGETVSGSIMNIRDI